MSGGTSADAAAEAKRVALRWLIAGDDIDTLTAQLAAMHRRNSLFPGDVLVELAAEGLAVAGVGPTAPMAYSGIRERYLPEVTFSGNADHQKSHTALRAVAMLHAGVVPDLGEDAGWWRADDFWLFAGYAFVIYMRAIADRAGGVGAVATRLAANQGISLG